MTVQTDCDQRDERLGWMGDANLSGMSLVTNFDLLAFLQWFVGVMADETNSDGTGVDVAPNVRYGSRPGDISWTAAFPTVSRALWVVDSDATVAKAYWDKLKLQLENVGTQCGGHAGASCPTRYGDWCPPPETPGNGRGPMPPRPYTSSFSFIGEVQDMATLAFAIGDNATGTHLQTVVLPKLHADFNDAYFNKGNATYGNGVMTAYTLPLHLGLVPADSQKEVESNLLATITAAKQHNKCGIIGMKFLFFALAGMGRKDTALAVLEQIDYPSIGYMAHNTLEPASENLWELLDAPFEGTGMNSRNHHMFSSFSLYLVQEAAGIKQAEGSVGFERVVFSPASALGLRSANATVAAAHGTIGIEWERAGGLQCAKAPPTEPVYLSCGAGGGVIKSVHFASHGRPHGVCGALGVEEDCHIDLVPLLAARCTGVNNCTLLPEEVASVAMSTGPCSSAIPGDPLWTHAQFSCSTPEVITATVTVPVGSTSTVKLPTDGVSRPVVTLNDKVVFSGGHGVGDVARVSHPTRGVVAVSVGSGTHSVQIASAMEGPSRVLLSSRSDGGQISARCPPGTAFSRVVFVDHAHPASAASHPTTSSCAIGQDLAHSAESICLGASSCTVPLPPTKCSDPLVFDALCSAV